MNDVFIILYIFFFISTALLVLIYFFRLRQEARNSLTAKKALDDIIISFNRDLESEKSVLQDLEEQEDKKFSNLEKSISNIEYRIHVLETRSDTFQQNIERLMKEQQEQRAKLESPSVYHTKEHESYSLKKLIGSQNTDMETPVTPAISLKKENVLSLLTNTEIQILKLLADEGGKSSHNIKEKIGLTREHTARLMKKLYTSGYVERRTEKMPYIYQPKKEIESLLNTLSSKT